VTWTVLLIQEFH